MKDIADSNHEADLVPVLRNFRVTCRISGLQTRFSGDCDNGCSPQPVLARHSSPWIKFSPGGPNGDEQFVDSRAQVHGYIPGKMWALLV